VVLVERWRRSHGRIGVSAPSWLTFEVHRPYFDGEQSELTAIQARGPVLAARRFEQRAPQAPRFGMVMPASFRQLLVEESRLTDYRVARPTDLPAALASPDWALLAEGFRDRGALDEVDRAGLALWLVAACLPDAVLDVAPSDADAGACADPLPALLQYARATALFQREGLSARTDAAFRPLVSAPRPTIAHVQAIAAWAYLTARHGADDSAALDQARQAARLLGVIAPTLPPFEQGIWRARLLLRESTYAERHRDLDAAWRLLGEASDASAQGAPATPEDGAVALEMRRRILDRRVEVAVRREDGPAEEAAIAEGIAIDPYCVKIRMQAAEAAERRGQLDDALAGFLLAARLGPYGTAFALLRAATCARRGGRDEVARVLEERAFRAAPRSERTRAALEAACTAAGDDALADVVRRAAGARSGAPAYANNWHFQMYGAYFNLGPSHSPCLYARIPQLAYEFAVGGDYPRVDVQRVMPPAFRTNLVRESGLAAFGVSHPAELPPAYRTDAWEQLCAWVADFDRSDLQRQYLTSLVLFRLGFRTLVLELVPERPVSSLSTPLEFYHYHWRDIAQYAASVGTSLVPPTVTFEMAEHPDCPLHLRLAAAVFGVVFSARETKSVDDAIRWREAAQAHLDAMLASDEFTPFEKTMLASRFYRGVSFVPHMLGKRIDLEEDMDRAESLAREVPASTPWERYLRQENLHACLESRSKEAFALRDIELGHRRTKEFLAIDPYDPKSHIELAESLAKQDRFREAADSYLRAARLGPLGTAIAYAMAGECFERAGDPVAAEDCFVQALRVDPYAVSAARGWRRSAAGTGQGGLAAEYADRLEEWGAARSASPAPAGRA
jgi:tetratricopeptide (TPR) repeat protein